MAETPKNEAEIKFRAIHEGMGFHPFADGLPYAPVVKKNAAQSPASMGTGATLAGSLGVSPSITRTSANPMPRIHVPVASQLREPIGARSSATVSKPALGPARAPELDVKAQPFGFLYVLKRSLAYLTDSALNLSAIAAALGTVLNQNGVTPEQLSDSGVIAISLAFLAFFNWAVITGQEVAFGTTVGKRVFGLALEGSPSAILLRAILFIPSTSVFGLGLAWSLFDREKRCWHDVAVGVQPRETARI